VSDYPNRAAEPYPNRATEPSNPRELAEYLVRFIWDEIDVLDDLTPAVILDGMACYGIVGASEAFMDELREARQ
jgi:hypothetical protein